MKNEKKNNSEILNIEYDHIKDDELNLDDKKENLVLSDLPNCHYEDISDNENSSKTKTFYERAFSPIIPGSIRAGIFTMSILSLGSGCLALPKKFANMSILVGIVDIILAGLSAYLTLKLLSISATKHKIYDYSKLIKKIVGKNWGNLLDISILIYTFGIIVLYNVISRIFIYFEIFYLSIFIYCFA